MKPGHVKTGHMKTGAHWSDRLTALSLGRRLAGLAIAPVLALVLALGLLLSVLQGPAAAAERPAALIETLNAVLLEVMRHAGELGYQGRYERLAPVLTATFNFPVMAGIAAGRHWRSLSPEQKREMAEVFRRMSIGTFARRFEGYGGERFEVEGEEPGPRGSVLVRNRLVKSDGETLEINYLMKRYEARWRVVDVYLDSKYSELATKRSEYTAILANEGFDGLIERIGRKLAAWGAQG